MKKKSFLRTKWKNLFVLEQAEKQEGEKMKKEKRKRTENEEFIEGLLEEETKVPEKEIGDDELFGSENLDGEHDDTEKAEDEHKLDFVEHGRIFGVPAKAVEAFAKAAGKSAGEVIGIYQKGCCFDELLKRYAAARKDSEAFEKIAKIRGIDKEEMKAEIMDVIENARFEKAVARIEQANPGMSRETAEELAKFRIEAEKTRSVKKQKNEKAEEIRRKLLEIDNFMAAHSAEGLGKINNGIVEEWENGVPLEKAYRTYVLENEKQKLLEEIEELKNYKTKDGQKFYAAEHSAGSARSSVKGAKIDEFIEGLFKEY